MRHSAIETGMPLVDALEKYIADSVVSFDVPAHKKNNKLRLIADFFGEKILAADVNSMKQLDNLSHPKGVIQEAQRLFAELYQADWAYFLVNGTTIGIQAMILASCNPGDKIIVPRNVHKSVLNAIILSAAEPIYVYPHVHPRLGIITTVSLRIVAETLQKHPDAKAIILINPSYYGVCCDMQAIIQLAHENQVTVLVDEAHGAHLPFSPQLPPSAITMGADLVTIGMHKTGGSLTQSSALLVQGTRVDSDRIQSSINMLQTTSASYLLLSSLDAARQELALRGEKQVHESLLLARFARQSIQEIEGLYAPGRELKYCSEVSNFDETKLVINTLGIGLTGFEFYSLLREEYRIQMEFGDSHNVVAFFTLGDTEQRMVDLIAAIKDLAAEYRREPLQLPVTFLEPPEWALSPREAFYAKKALIPIDQSLGHISGEMITVYPPGIPLLVPGERLTKEIIEYIMFLKSTNGTITDLADPQIEKIKVVVTS
ncbi:MAG: aminotransferase class I/II-fold pyridoxal phosphate-dependent enzyme [Chlamydiales bacterium]